MTDYIDLALNYGGFTSLDRVYLEQVLTGLTEEQKRSFITPPPSVINAYFAELYQKKSPEAATEYFLEISQALDLWNAEPSFVENKPFVRLNLSGKSYGFCYEKKEVGMVFPENPEPVTADLLFEIAQVFPHYLVYEEAGRIKMTPFKAEFQVVDSKELTALTEWQQLADGSQRLLGYNQDEVSDLAQSYAGRKYYHSQNRSAMIYII
ncbi:cystathionine beta-lyase [Streptococcus gordonii]|uniref:cystathionine beta-lyase n=1 Tax=Streptococcus gordonii TaxID=1302 RepID=UPI002284A2AC|nr:cystathionine beta-lyase [Streptococcus gordonii]MCY7139879.1 cystathionine beta-lyase [Streptococcus gordonii]